MAAAGYIYKAVTQQLAEMDEMDVPEMEWNIFDEEFLSTDEVIAAMFAADIPSMVKLANDLEAIVARENDWEEDED